MNGLKFIGGDEVQFTPTAYEGKVQRELRKIRGVLKKRCFENMQQIYRRTVMLKGDFNKVASAWVFSCKFAAYFQSTFS